MVLFEIAAYIFLVVLIIFVSPRILWLVFFLFCYRFCESIIKFEWFGKSFSVDPAFYYIMIVIVAACLYALVWYATRTVPFLRYILLLMMIFYTIKVHVFEIGNILLFKDYLEQKGMWDFGYWKKQVHDLLSFSAEDAEAMFKGIWMKFWNALKRFAEGVKGLIDG